MANNLKFLHNALFSELYLWDVKRLIKSRFDSKFKIVRLGDYIFERTDKVKLYDFPNKEFGILGVNNKEGIFDAYTEKGENINQAYKVVNDFDLAYNPYRINVGSIGIKTPKHKNQFISPAYVVFGCKKEINPEYLYRLFKSTTFNSIINDNTTGSVRQNLKFNTLSNIKIPLPPIEIQNKLISTYNNLVLLAFEQESKAKELEENIERYLYSELGCKKEDNIKNVRLRTISYSKLTRWDFKEVYTLISKYPVIKVSEIVQSISTGTTPPTSHQEYFESATVNFYTPADLGVEMYLKNSERKINEQAIRDKKARQFNRDTLLFVGIGSTVGKVGIVGNDFATSNQQITGLTFFQNDLNLEYAYYYFEYFKHITTKESTQATIPIVNQEKILNIPIPLPSKVIQDNIVLNINSIKKKIRVLKAEVESKIEEANTIIEKQVFGIK